MTKKHLRWESLNFPNLLTIARTIMAIILPFMALSATTFMDRLIVGIVFTIAAVTDFVDGYLARRDGTITVLGKILDPIADKVLMLGAFFTLSFMGLFPMWIVIPIVIREVLITVIRFYFLYKGIAVAAVKSGKMKTVFQIVAVSAVFVNWVYKKDIRPLLEPNVGDPIGVVLSVLMYIFLALAVYWTLYSGYIFFKNNWHLFRS